MTNSAAFSCALLLATGLLTACAAPPPAGPAAMVLQPFSTDGCSRFLDRSPVGSADWCHCCVAHDLAYWRGGSAEQRLQADHELKTCVQRASGDSVLAELMFAGVRAGGGPEFDTPYRWGYGWPFGRGYQPLMPQEAERAAALELDYRAGPAPLACPSAAGATARREAPAPAAR